MSKFKTGWRNFWKGFAKATKKIVSTVWKNGGKELAIAKGKEKLSKIGKRK